MFCSVLFCCFAPHMSRSPQLQSSQSQASRPEVFSVHSFLGVVSCCLCVSLSLLTVALNAWAHPGLLAAVTVTWKQQEPLPPFLLNVINDLLGVYLAEYSYWSTLPLLLLIRNLSSGSLYQNLSVFQIQLPSALYLELSSCFPS